MSVSIQGLMHTIAGALDHAILLIWTSLGLEGLEAALTPIRRIGSLH